MFQLQAKIYTSDHSIFGLLLDSFEQTGWILWTFIRPLLDFVVRLFSPMVRQEFFQVFLIPEHFREMVLFDIASINFSWLICLVKTIRHLFGNFGKTSATLGC